MGMTTIFKGTKIYSVLTGCCPVCHEESMYSSNQLYQLKNTLQMKEKCANCGTKFKIEPSFFYGAMYVSYPVGIIFAAITFLIAHFVFNSNLLISFFLIVAVLILALPVILRLSRNIWINLFMKYKRVKY